MKESIYWIKILIKVAQQPQQILDGYNQIEATTSIKKDRSQWPPKSPYSSINATLGYVAASKKTSGIQEQDRRSWFRVLYKPSNHT